MRARPASRWQLRPCTSRPRPKETAWLLSPRYLSQALAASRHLSRKRTLRLPAVHHRLRERLHALLRLKGWFNCPLYDPRKAQANHWSTNHLSFFSRTQQLTRISSSQSPRLVRRRRLPQVALYSVRRIVTRCRLSHCGSAARAVQLTMRVITCLRLRERSHHLHAAPQLAASMSVMRCSNRFSTNSTFLLRYFL